jgi:pimeloyl-ACP methyl ester carboxylesterase
MNTTKIAVLTMLLAGYALAAPDGGYPLKRTTYYMTMPIDHFASGGAGGATFQMRYFVDAQFWDPQTGPILFYAGNEGRLENFYDNTGFMTKNLSRELKGLIVFGEHRYFGESMPFPAATAFNTSNNTYLTVDQVMADYNLLIKSIKFQYGAMDKPVIVFGGSYGGMLAAWLRMKYPQTFQGALASSAPILYFKGAPTAPEDAFGDLISQSFGNVTLKCNSTIREGFYSMQDIRNDSNRKGDWGALSTAFNTCKPI